MDGRALATALANALPRVHIVFMSGYTDDAVLHRGLVDSACLSTEAVYGRRTCAYH